MKRKTVIPEPAEVPQPGAIASCERCGVKLRVSETRREDSDPFRRSLTTKGVCPDCVMTQFLYNTYPINWQLDERGPNLLLNPLIRESFLSAGIMDRCEMSIDEVNWQRVVANWNLPVEVSKDGRNPYRMGDAKKNGPSGTFGTGFLTGNRDKGDDALNPTVLCCDLGSMDDSPWFFDALIEFLEAQKGEAGAVYRFDGSFRNYVFRGKIRRLDLGFTAGGKA